MSQHRRPSFVLDLADLRRRLAASLVAPCVALAAGAVLAPDAAAQAGLLGASQRHASARLAAPATAASPALESAAAAQDVAAEQAFGAAVRAERRAAAARRLTAALERPTLEGLLAAGESAVREIGGGTTARLVERQLNAARAAALSNRERAADELAARLERLASDLVFEPVLEAPVPPGFPTPTPVHEIVLERYPTYRMATAPMQNGDNRAFWTLFQHIESNGIPMTAPVETTFDETRERPRAATMAFLYDVESRGEVGAAGSVDVVDAQPMLVVSLGLRGNETRERVEAARAQLLRWIEERGDLVPAGNLRTMGFNSPMVLGNRRYFQVQIPVQRVPPLATGERPLAPTGSSAARAH
jgi:hypothetical protein